MLLNNLVWRERERERGGGRGYKKVFARGGGGGGNFNSGVGRNTSKKGVLTRKGWTKNRWRGFDHQSNYV